MTVLKILWQEQETNTEIIFEVDYGATKTWLFVVLYKSISLS